MLAWGYWGIFLLMVLENVIPPVPSEAIMGIAGLARQGAFRSGAAGAGSSRSAPCGQFVLVGERTPARL